ncbi:MAG: hypothetical protein FWD25_11370 [Clostridia bacterium]|nr:hypothetical protein [Clostridia bacterium]
MTKRENLLSLMRRQGYDSVPVEFSLCPHLHHIYKEKTGGALPFDEYFGFPWKRVEGIRLPPRDLAMFRPFFDPPLKENADIDAWGVGHEHSPHSMHMTYMRHPMRNMTERKEIEAYPFPDFAGGDTGHMKAQAQAIKKQGLAAVGDMPCTIWESAWYLRGMEELMMDMMSDDEAASILLGKVTEIACLRAAAYARADVDILFLGDDIGMQHTPMMSLDLYRAWIKPNLKKVIGTARNINPNILVFYHSCGFATPFIDDLIDAGVDVLNPVQSECMDFGEIHAQYGHKISFHGTIGTQTVMPFGTPEEVRETVRRNLDIAGKRGGLFPAPTHLLEPEVPWENVLAYVDACRTYK